MEDEELNKKDLENKEDNNIEPIEEIHGKIFNIVKSFLLGKSFGNPPEQETLS